MAFKNSCVSISVKGSNLIVCITRLCNPSRVLMILSIIHDAADPQITTFYCAFREATAFQQWSNACRKPDLGRSIQGNSSKKTTPVLSVGRLFKYLLSIVNAFSQLFGVANSNAHSVASCSVSLKFSSWAFVDDSCSQKVRKLFYQLSLSHTPTPVDRN